eukprot:gene22307-42570_t
MAMPAAAAQPHQIGHLDLHRHGAAVGRTGVAQTGFIAGPSFATVNVDNGNGRSHAVDYPRMNAWRPHDTLRLLALRPNSGKSSASAPADRPLVWWLRSQRPPA